MPTQLARFTDGCIDWCQKYIVGKPQPALQQGNGGYADWVIFANVPVRVWFQPNTGGGMITLI